MLLLLHSIRHKFKCSTLNTQVSINMRNCHSAIEVKINWQCNVHAIVPSVEADPLENTSCYSTVRHVSLEKGFCKTAFPWEAPSPQHLLRSLASPHSMAQAQQSKTLPQLQGGGCSH